MVLDEFVDHENIGLEHKFIILGWMVKFLENSEYSLRGFFKKVWLVVKI